MKSMKWIAVVLTVALFATLINPAMFAAFSFSIDSLTFSSPPTKPPSSSAVYTGTLVIDKIDPIAATDKTIQLTIQGSPATMSILSYTPTIISTGTTTETITFQLSVNSSVTPGTYSLCVDIDALLTQTVTFEVYPSTIVGEGFKVESFKPDRPIFPGDTYGCTIVLSNPNTTALTGPMTLSVRGSSALFQVFGYPNTISIPGNDEPSQTFKIWVDPTVSPGTYTLDVQIGSITRSINFTVNDRNAGGAPGNRVILSSYSLSHKIISPGESFSLALTFLNVPHGATLQFNTSKFYLSTGWGYGNLEIGVTSGTTRTLNLTASQNVSQGTTELIEATVTWMEGATEQSATFSIPIDIREAAVTPTPTPSSGILTPHLVITGFKLEDVLIPGEEFDFSVSFMNTSKTVDIENVMLTVSLPAGVTLANASTNFYIARIKAGGYGSQKLTFFSDKSVPDGISTLGLAFSYQYLDEGVYAAGTDTEQLGMYFSKTGEAAGDDRFEINKLEMPDYLMAGYEEYLTITVINKGMEPVNNVTATIRSDLISNSGATEYFGMLNANVKGEIELPINPIQGGDITGTITITYELQDGTQKELVHDFSAFADEAYTEPHPGPDDPSWNEDPNLIDEPGLPFWATLLIIVGSLGILVGGALITVKIIKKKKRQIEDIEDEDF